MALLRALADGKPSDVLSERGLDAERFEAAAVAWGQVLRRDEAVQELLAAGLRAGPE